MSLPDPAKSKGANDPNASTREDVMKVSASLVWVGSRASIGVLNRGPRLCLATCLQEIDILAQCDHPNVMFLKEYFEESNKIYLITELLTGGELLDAVLEKGNYAERDAKACMKQLLRGIEYLHSRNIAHRDLKLENLLLCKKGDISKIKIVDFGLAKRAVESHLETICGTPQYVAPEVIQGVPGNKYDPKVDMWSAGVIMFILLGGYPPFYDEHEPRLFQKIRRGLFSFDDPVWNDVSATAKDLIRKLLVVDPSGRLTATQALAHEWFKDCPSTDDKELLATRNNMHRNALDGQLSARFSARVAPIAPDGAVGDVAAKFEKFRIENEKKLKDGEDD